MINNHKSSGETERLTMKLVSVVEIVQYPAKDSSSTSSTSSSSLHVVKVVGQSDEEAANDKVDKSPGESRSDASAARYQIADHQHRQTSVQIRLSSG